MIQSSFTKNCSALRRRSRINQECSCPMTSALLNILQRTCSSQCTTFRLELDSLIENLKCPHCNELIDRNISRILSGTEEICVGKWTSRFKQILMRLKPFLQQRETRRFGPGQGKVLCQTQQQQQCKAAVTKILSWSDLNYSPLDPTVTNLTQPGTRRVLSQ